MLFYLIGITIGAAALSGLLIGTIFSGLLCYHSCYKVDKYINSISASDTFLADPSNIADPSKHNKFFWDDSGVLVMDPHEDNKKAYNMWKEIYIPEALHNELRPNTTTTFMEKERD